MAIYPIFLLPKGEIMMTAKIEDQEIILLKKTLFPSACKYAISDNGIAACLDKDKKLILYGQLNERGEFDYLRILPFPSIISPKSICLLKYNLILGGENNSHELVVSYSISQDKFIPVEMPFKQYGKSIDDFLVDNNRVIAVDNIVYPKYLIEYDFSNPDYPHLIKSFNLPENGTYESIKKGTQNESYIALISSTFGMDGGGHYINIFHKRTYDNYIRLSQWFGERNKYKKQEKKYYWRDILLVPDKNILLLSSNEDGIGIYYIEDSLIGAKEKEDSGSIVYFNNWEKKVIKLLCPPNDSENLILIFENGEDNNLVYTYTLERIDSILDNFERDSYDNVSEWQEENDYHESYDDYGDSDVCGACQESPCRCSDRESTSTIHDF